MERERRCVFERVCAFFTVDRIRRKVTQKERSNAKERDTNRRKST